MLPEIPVATGSLGHGFPMSCGIALAKKVAKYDSVSVSQGTKSYPA